MSSEKREITVDPKEAFFEGVKLIGLLLSDFSLDSPAFPLICTPLYQCDFAVEVWLLFSVEL